MSQQSKKDSRRRNNTKTKVAEFKTSSKISVSDDDSQELPSLKQPKSKYRIPKVVTPAARANDNVPQELSSVLNMLAKINKGNEKTDKDIEKKIDDAIAEVAAKTKAEEEKKAQELKQAKEEQEANSKLSSNNVGLASVGFVDEFAKLEAILFQTVDEEQFHQLMNAMIRKVNYILPSSFMAELHNLTRDDQIVIHILRGIDRETNELMQLCLYPVLLSHLACALFSVEETIQITATWKELNTEFRNFLTAFFDSRTTVDPLHLLASIHLSIQHIVRESKSTTELCLLYQKVMPLYNCVFLQLFKRDSDDFTTDHQPIIASMLLDIFSIHALNCAVTKVSFMIVLPEHQLVAKLFNNALGCCDFDVSSTFELFTDMVRRFLTNKPIAAALELWLDLFKSTPISFEPAQPHVIYLTIKQIGTRVKEFQKMQEGYDLRGVLANFNEVLDQLRLIAPHLSRKRVEGKSKEFNYNETSHLLAMFHFAVKIVTSDQYGGLFKVVKGLQQLLTNLSPKNKMFLAQMDTMLAEQAEIRGEYRSTLLY